MFAKALKHWGSPQFSHYFSHAFLSIKLANLPLQNCCQQQALIDENTLKVMILSTEDLPYQLRLKIAVLFAKVMPGCPCSDDAAQATTLENGYCELQVDIDKTTTQAVFANVSL